METPDSLRDAIVWFDDFDHCREFMIDLRWPDGVVKCPQCESDKVIWIPKERVWKCYGRHDRAKFSLKTGTIFEDSPIKLEKWLPATWLIVNCKNGISSYELHRDLKVTQKTAWFMLHRIRLAMQSGTFTKLSGEIEADETFVGGKVTNMHRHAKRTIQAKNDGQWGKTVVLGLLQRDGQVRAAVAPSRRKHLVHGHIMDNVERGSKIYTDEFNAYDNLPADYPREFVNHLSSYVNGRVHTNGIENFWSLLKRTLKGTYVSVDPAHLFRYVEEQVFRYNNRKDMNDAERFVTVMKQIVGKRITYDELIGKAEDRSSEALPF